MTRKGGGEEEEKCAKGAPQQVDAAAAAAAAAERASDFGCRNCQRRGAAARSGREAEREDAERPQGSAQQLPPLSIATACLGARDYVERVIYNNCSTPKGWAGREQGTRPAPETSSDEDQIARALSFSVAHSPPNPAPKPTPVFGCPSLDCLHRRLRVLTIKAERNDLSAGAPDSISQLGAPPPLPPPPSRSCSRLAQGEERRKSIGQPLGASPSRRLRLPPVKTGCWERARRPPPPTRPLSPLLCRS